VSLTIAVCTLAVSVSLLAVVIQLTNLYRQGAALLQRIDAFAPTPDRA